MACKMDLFFPFFYYYFGITAIYPIFLFQGLLLFIYYIEGNYSNRHNFINNLKLIDFFVDCYVVPTNLTEDICASHPTRWSNGLVKRWLTVSQPQVVTCDKIIWAAISFWLKPSLLYVKFPLGLLDNNIFRIFCV